MEGYIGEIRFFAGNFAPKNWMFCDGQLLKISEYTPFFAIISDRFGGDARTTFGLPDLRHKVAIGTGRGPALSNVALSQQGGASQISLTEQQMPKHNHEINAANENGDVASPAGAYPAVSNGTMTVGRSNFPYQNAEYSNQDSNSQMNSDALSLAGQNGAHNNMQPYLACNYIICVDGLFPSRN